MYKQHPATKTRFLCQATHSSVEPKGRSSLTFQQAAQLLSSAREKKTLRATPWFPFAGRAKFKRSLPCFYDGMRVSAEEWIWTPFSCFFPFLIVLSQLHLAFSPKPERASESKLYKVPHFQAGLSYDLVFGEVTRASPPAPLCILREAQWVDRRMETEMYLFSYPSSVVLGSSKTPHT